jgi:hypothetical protein
MTRSWPDSPVIRSIASGLRRLAAWRIGSISWSTGSLARALSYSASGRSMRVAGRVSRAPNRSPADARGELDVAGPGEHDACPPADVDGALVEACGNGEAVAIDDDQAHALESRTMPYGTLVANRRNRGFPWIQAH